MAHLKSRIITIAVLGTVIFFSYLVKQTQHTHHWPDEKLTGSDIEKTLNSDQVTGALQDKQVMLTLDGWDHASQSTIDPINLWENYDTRTFSGIAHHGDSVRLVTRKGDGVLIETESGVKGWVTYTFIKEFKTD